MVWVRRRALRASLAVVLPASLPWVLTGCGGTRGGAGPGGGYESGGGFQSCVPYARARSGLDLRGNAWEWWDASAGRYDRGARPRAGSVLVFQRSARLPDGHVSVVSRVVGAREIRVDHANWATGSDRGRVARDQAVVDVSERGDWSRVRVWYPPVAAVGNTTYAAYGFVHAGRGWASAE